MMETDDLFYENSNGSMKMNGHGKNVSRADSSTLNQEVAAQAVPDAGDEADVIDLFDESPEKIERNDFSENSEISREGKGAKPDIAEIAKKRLSKWAARLFDPDRRRGLIETPEIIPLNDEFLSAFGKRTKKDVEELGQNIVIDNSNLDEAEPDVDVMEEPTAKKARKEKVGVKVKLSNLPFIISQDYLHRWCEKFGSILLTNMITNDSGNSTGRAYVTFEETDAAAACVKAMHEKSFQGRILNVTIAQDNKKSRRSGGVGNLQRFWEEDLSTKCFRCGKVGHMASACPNEEKPRPCHKCGQTTHDPRRCPLNMVCFNCGVPGHRSQDCKLPRGMPSRLLCGTCFESGHHRWQCSAQPWHIRSYDAICLVCGKTGHFMCKDIQWTHTLKGVSCFNCGERGHHGSQCRRPLVNECNDETALREIERAETWSCANDENVISENMPQQQRGRTTSRERGSGNGSRARSLPHVNSSMAYDRDRDLNYDRGRDHEHAYVRKRDLGYDRKNDRDHHRDHARVYDRDRDSRGSGRRYR